jgi:hypothetical protein
MSVPWVPGMDDHGPREPGLVCGCGCGSVWVDMVPFQRKPDLAPQ